MQIVNIIFNIWILSISYFVLQVLSFASIFLNLNLNFSFWITTFYMIVINFNSGVYFCFILQVLILSFKLFSF